MQPASSANVLPVQLDSQGRVKYDALVKQGQRKDKVIFHQYQLIDFMLVFVVPEWMMLFNENIMQGFTLHSTPVHVQSRFLWYGTCT